MKVCCMAKDCYRNYSVASHKLQGRLNIDFFHKNPSNVNDFTFKMSEKQWKICLWLQFVLVINLHVENPKYCLRLSKSNMAEIYYTK